MREQIMRRMYKFFWILGLLSFSLLAHAAQVQIAGISYSSSAQVLFDLSETAHYRVFALSNPSRLVVDFNNAHLQQAINSPPADHPLFAAVRSSPRNKNDLRVVFELNTDVDAKSMLVNKPGGAQLQLDLVVKEKPMAKMENAPLPVMPSPKSRPIETAALLPKPERVKVNKAKGRDIVVAIDAGHGGKDVGAQGLNGTQEKDVVFAIAKRLEGMVNSQPGMKAVMIRKGDYFVKLHERVRLARAAKADLFVSIHADAFEDPTAHGASVYTLSNKGASSESARFLADSENASDLAGGVSLDDRDDTLASVLLDLSQTAAKEASQNIGNKVLRHVKSVGHLHRSAVQKAGFVVLKSPDIPSILVETAFISNPQEEQRLNTSAYQNKMASAVFGGILSHFRQYAPANTLMAQLSKSGKLPSVAMRETVEPVPADKPMLAHNDQNSIEIASGAKHVINRGETLSGIAQQYGVSMRALRTANGMADGDVRVGQVLQIPRSI
ncbi:MAG: N-acetylmuramoyl-L-alanine amidase [Methylomonas sp.]